MRCFSIIGTAHLDDLGLFRALERALDQANPDQLLVEIPDEAVLRGEIVGQKPEMVCAYRWAEHRGTPVRGHEPAGPSVLRAELPPGRVVELLQAMDRLIAQLSVRETIDVFCARRELVTGAQYQLHAVIEELIDPVQAAARTVAMIEGIGRVAAPSGSIWVVCGGAHASRIAEALDGARLIHGEFFF